MLPPLEDFPDSVFVEDPAFVIPEAAILLQPGAPTRMGEAARSRRRWRGVSSACSSSTRASPTAATS